MSLDGEPLDEDYVRTRLSQPPFVTIDGVLNIRDLGSYQTADPSFITKPSLIYRSGEVAGITEEGIFLISPSTRIATQSRELGKSQLKSLGITHIFDLRSDPEMAKWQSSIPEIDGVEVIHTPVFKNEDYSPEMMAKCVPSVSTASPHSYVQPFSRKFKLYSANKTEVRRK